MTPKQVENIIAKVLKLSDAFIEVENAWDAESDVLSDPDYFPFSESLDDLRAKVVKWANHVEINLHDEVSWYDRNRAILEGFFGKPDIQHSSADWCGCDVWTLKSEQIGDVLTRQCLVIAKDDNPDQVILTIRTDDEYGSTWNDLLFIHQDEQKLLGLMQVLTRHKC